MTLCLAGIYDNGAGAILAADKMTGLSVRRGNVTEPELVKQEREDTYKIKMLTDDIAVITAGDGDWTDALIRDIQKKIHIHKNIKFFKVLKISLATFRQHYLDLILRQELMPLGFESFDDYHRKALQYDRQRIEQIDLRLKAFNVPIDIALVGKGENGYEIQEIDAPGTSQIIRYGFTALGNGKNYALPVLADTYYPTMNRKQATAILKKAKVEGEKDPSVGEKTDWVYLPIETE
ncbi:MAG TPA: hypothetical protein VMR28_01640 [Candidatus Saccharimonadales bacterium]|nr:hypothetical protein [Candidatus Saccharimonadales bacterium]